MNKEQNTVRADQQLLLDKLVDGELDDQQCRQLLVELDTLPDGWRRCAMAFLEAQSWRKAMGTLVAAPAKETLPRPTNVGQRRTKPWGTFLAAAASFLLAFGLGQVWRGQPQPVGIKDLVRSTPSASKDGSASSQPQWGSMTVAMDRNDDGTLDSVELPVARGPGIDEQWVRSQPATIPSHILRAMERKGHHVQHQRQYYPFSVGGGNQVLVPVDELDVQFVGERQFQ